MGLLPGHFPFAAGIFPFKRADEDPKRMFAGEGGPLRTNTRFHYLSKDDNAKRLSTAFDSVTLYGEDPDKRPDIFGKIGNSIAPIKNLSQSLIRDYFRLPLILPPDSSTGVSLTGAGGISIRVINYRFSVKAQIRMLHPYPPTSPTSPTSPTPPSEESQTIKNNLFKGTSC
jgi:methylmalonyl-CoA mutase